MAVPADFPRTAAPDSTLALLREGYDFIGNRCRRLGSDAFRTRLLMQEVLCMTGPEAAELFYGSDRFGRHGAMPVTVLKLLQDRGSVQSLEGPPHRHRKRLFLELTTGDEIEHMRTCFVEAWQRHARGWSNRPSVVLYDALYAILTEAACAWAGIPPRQVALPRLTEELRAMVEGAGSVGPRNWRALWLRRRAERWACRLLLDVRDGSAAVEPQRPAHRLAWYRDAEGRLLPADHAAVELLNLLRPIAAVAIFIAFSALALHERPQWQEAFARGEEADLNGFVQEVRRLTPFFPMIGGRARSELRWRGRVIPRDHWVLLDLYGTCRDPRAWDAPKEFRPERFRDREPGPYALVPQGAGDHSSGHRCPGEWVTIALMEEAIRLLTRCLRYRVPPQDLSVKLSQMPARPRSGFVMADAAPLGP